MKTSISNAGIAITAFCTVFAPVAAKSKNSPKPNVIFIFSDQHRADVMGFQGHPDVKTPNLDAMAKGGVVFNRAYCQNAISAPSRMSMFTGLYPRTIGALDNTYLNTTAVNSATSLQSVFQSNGYATYAFGKRHLDAKADEGWTIRKSHMAHESPDNNYVKWIEEQGYADEFGQDWAAEFGKYPEGNTKAGTKYPNAKMGTRTTKLPENMTMEAYSTQLTLDVIRKHKETGTPFFCFTSYYRPHQPYNPLPKYLAMYDMTKWGRGTRFNDGIKMPESMRQPADQLPPMLAALRTSKNGIWCLGLAAGDEQLYRDYIGAYYALVTEIDALIGEIFAELEKAGMAENTIVIYSSDHGDFVGAHGMIEKAALGHNVYEETLQVPLMFYRKGKYPAGYRNDDLVGLIDLYPTLLELAGIPQPKTNYPLQGISLANTILKKAPIKRKYMISENWSQAAVITKDYKLGIMLDPTVAASKRDYRNFGDMLFERKSDPFEVNNRIHAPELQPVVKQLKQYYAEFEKTISDEGKKQMVENAVKGPKDVRK